MPEARLLNAFYRNILPRVQGGEGTDKTVMSRAIRRSSKCLYSLLVCGAAVLLVPSLTRADLRERFLENLKGFERYYDLGIALCETERGADKTTAVETQKLKTMVESHLASEVKKSGRDRSGDVYFMLNETRKKTIYWRSNHCLEYYLDPDPDFLLSRKIIDADFYGCLDAESCRWNKIRSIEMVAGETDPKHSVRRRFRLDDQGEVNGEFYLHRPVLRIDEIYGASGSGGENLPVPELAPADRVVVGVIDSGVDYNHPLLAYGLRRKPNSVIPETESKITAAEKKIAQLAKAPKKVNGQLISRLMNARYEYEKKKVLRLKNKLARLRAEEPIAVGKDLIDDDGSPYDYDSTLDQEQAFNFTHGTAVAAIIISASSDLVVEPVRTGARAVLDIGVGVSYLVDEGARVINVSLGSNKSSHWKALRHAIRKYPHVIFVIAAGNDGKDVETEIDHYPVEFVEGNILVVAAVDNEKKLWQHSNYGKKSVDLGAPGVNVQAACPEQKSCLKTGTSFAAPYVAATIGMMQKLDRKITKREIFQILKNTVDRTSELKKKTKFGGVVNRERALDLLRKRLTQ